MQLKPWITGNIALLFLISTTASSPINSADDPVVIDDTSHSANHIFNAIHSSMRQWGSSWNHNGMSFFLATVPANTEFYHGTHESKAIQGLEWLAFEPEHALTFASRPPGGPGRGRRGGLPGRGPPGQEPPSSKAKQERSIPRGIHQKPIQSTTDDHELLKPPPSTDETPGYLHIYQTKHALSLLYIDGISGGKTKVGTLDSQDYILRSPKEQTLLKGGSGPGGPMDEVQRATDLCDRAANEWQGKIDGFIRMEMGFEVILCNFSAHLNLISALQVRNSSSIPQDSPIYNQQFAWYQGIAPRFDGIGNNRVTLNYDDFITAFAYPDIELFPKNTSDPMKLLPRLKNLSTSALSTIRHDADAMVLRSANVGNTVHTNWQAIADMIITRYGTVIPYLSNLTNQTTLVQTIDMLMRPFISYSSRDLSTEISRCTNHFLPPVLPISPSSPSSSSSAARDAITSISHKICTTLLSALYNPSPSPSQSPQNSFKELAKYLDWTVWRRCPTQCDYDEVCFIPIWPLGTVADRERGVGRCLNATEMMKGGRMGFGPRPGPGNGHGGDNDDGDSSKKSYWMAPGDEWAGSPGGGPPAMSKMNSKHVGDCGDSDGRKGTPSLGWWS